MSKNSEVPLKVLLWSPLGSGEHYNGPGSFTYRLYSSAPKNEITVSLAHGAEDQKEYSLFNSQHRIGTMSGRYLDQIRFISKGCNWIEKNASDYDVVHTVSGFHYSILPAFKAEKSGVPAVVFISNHLSQLGIPTGWKRLLGLAKKRQKMAQHLSGLIAMSEDIRKELLSYGIREDNIVNIPMGVNTDVFFPVDEYLEKSLLRSKYGWRETPTILFAGSIVRRKQPGLIVEAIGLLKKRKIDFQLILVGPVTDDVYADEIKDRVKVLGLSEMVKWIPFTPDIAPLYRAADIFCLPSLNEGMAASLIEGMASGLACVVTPVSGSSDVITNGENGFLVKPDASDIADALSNYAKEPELIKLHGDRCLYRVLNKYSSKVVYEAYNNLFRRVSQGQSAAG